VTDDDDRLIPLVVKHSDLVEYLQVSSAVIENPARPDWFRVAAQEFYAQCSHAMLYENDPAKRVSLQWLSFGVRNFYRDLVTETLDRLGDGVKDQPVRAQMARQCAAMCDNITYSNDFRCSALTALREVLKSLEPTGLTVVT
jgi:hypothetical protein